MCDPEITRRQALLIWAGCMVGMVLIVAWCFVLHRLGVW
jgi:hypothetical protein